MRQILIALVAIIAGIIVGSYIPNYTVIEKPIQIGDVPDLIHRLKSVTKERYQYTLGTDVRICFEGDVSVEIQLNMKNNNEYTAKASTLSATVAAITSPSDEIKNALVGWGKPQ